MPWCNKCREEYIKDIKECPECGAVLSATKDNNTTLNKDSITNADKHLELKLLFTIENNIEFALITDALRQENIPFSTVAEKLWDHMQVIYAKSNIGQSVFVSEDDYDKAKAVLDYFKEMKDAWSKENKD